MGRAGGWRVRACLGEIGRQGGELMVDMPFPGMAKDSLDLQRKLAACDRLAAIAQDLSDRKLSVGNTPLHPPIDGMPSMPLCVFEEFGRALKTFRACVQPASTGYGQPAQALAAIVVQWSLIVLWADKKGDAVCRMADLHARYGLQKDLDERRRLGLWKGFQTRITLKGFGCGSSGVTFIRQPA
jgi:hypothetical protein